MFVGMEDIVIEHVNGVPIIKIRKAPPPVRERRPIWSNEEVRTMLKIIKDKNIVSLLYGGKYRKNDVFKVVAANLKKAGYSRTSEQISTKWKHLRLTYAHHKAALKCDALKTGNVYKQECIFYNEMEELLGDKLQIVGVDSCDIDDSQQKIEQIEAEIVEHEKGEIEYPIKGEVQIEISETDFDQSDFSNVEVISTDVIDTDFSQNDYSKVEMYQTDASDVEELQPGPSGHEEIVVVEEEEDEEERFHDEMDYSQTLESEATVVETSPLKKTKRKRLFRVPPTRFKKPNEGTYSNALKSFTKEWESMMERVAEREREQDRLEKEKEKLEQRRWEERLIEQQSAAMSKANSEFLLGLKGLFNELKK